jgi:hypothetical protein
MSDVLRPISPQHVVVGSRISVPLTLFMQMQSSGSSCHLHTSLSRASNRLALSASAAEEKTTSALAAFMLCSRSGVTQ